MNPAEFNQQTAVQNATSVEIKTQPEYRVTLTIAVHHANALWAAAVEKAMSRPGTRLEDVLDVIGPPEDPSISECIAMLVLPKNLLGCEVDDFWIDSMPGLPSLSTLRG